MSIKALAWLLLMPVLSLPALARDPADADEPVPPARYSPVMAGTKSFRPVEPLPWGDVNRRVAPPGAVVPQGPEQGKGTPRRKGRN